MARKKDVRIVEVQRDVHHRMGKIDNRYKSPIEGVIAKERGKHRRKKEYPVI
jgi:hypothetical protein